MPLRLAAGVVLILVGVVGLVFPVMPGWVFVIVGLLVLSPNCRFSRWIRHKAHQLRQSVEEYRLRRRAG